MKKSLFYFFLCAFAATTWTACDKDDDLVDDEDEELITTLNVALTSAAGSATLNFQDLDGEGGNDGTTTGATLAANTTYAFSTTFLNESESPAEDITVEVSEESDEHFVAYQASGVTLDVTYGDTDNDGNPLGLVGTITTGDAGTGNFQVILRHEPVKTATGATGGSIDIDVTFPVTIQ